MSLTLLAMTLPVIASPSPHVILSEAKDLNAKNLAQGKLHESISLPFVATIGIATGLMPLAMTG